MDELGDMEPMPANLTDVGTRMRDIHIFIWGIRLPPFTRVGHVMITEADRQTVCVSQYPYSPGQHPAFVLHGPNHTFRCDDTMRAEQGPPSIEYRATVLNELAFDAMAANHRQRPSWCVNPMPPLETHCARSGYDCLKAAGFIFDVGWNYGIRDGQRNQILPSVLWAFLADTPGMVPVQASEPTPTLAEAVQQEQQLTQELAAM